VIYGRLRTRSMTRQSTIPGVSPVVQPHQSGMKRVRPGASRAGEDRSPEAHRRDLAATRPAGERGTTATVRVEPGGWGHGAHASISSLGHQRVGVADPAVSMQRYNTQPFAVLRKRTPRKTTATLKEMRIDRRDKSLWTIVVQPGFSTPELTAVI